MIGSGDPSLPPKIAVPPFIALTNDSETQAAAMTIGEVLWDDLEFEKEFYMIPRDTYRTIPPRARSMTCRWTDGRSSARRCVDRKRPEDADWRDRAVSPDQCRLGRIRDGEG